MKKKSKDNLLDVTKSYVELFTKDSRLNQGRILVIATDETSNDEFDCVTILGNAGSIHVNRMVAEFYKHLSTKSGDKEVDEANFIIRRIFIGNALISTDRDEMKEILTLCMQDHSDFRELIKSLANMSDEELNNFKPKYQR